MFSPVAEVVTNSLIRQSSRTCVLRRGVRSLQRRFGFSARLEKVMGGRDPQSIKCEYIRPTNAHGVSRCCFLLRGGRGVAAVRRMQDLDACSSLNLEGSSQSEIINHTDASAALYSWTAQWLWSLPACSKSSNVPAPCKGRDGTAMGSMLSLAMSLV